MRAIPDRCGYGQRLPFLVISPFARRNYVSNSTIDTSSIPAFIENNWLGGARTGTASFDNLAGSITDMFKFSQPNDSTLLLNPRTGEVAH